MQASFPRRLKNIKSDCYKNLLKWDNQIWLQECLKDVLHRDLTMTPQTLYIWTFRHSLKLT